MYAYFSVCDAQQGRSKGVSLSVSLSLSLSLSLSVLQLMCSLLLRQCAIINCRARLLHFIYRRWQFVLVPMIGGLSTLCVHGARGMAPPRQCHEQNYCLHGLRLRRKV